MKNTKIAVAALITFILTWLIIGFIAYMVTDDYTYKYILISPGMLAFMFILGWLPALIVGIDLYEELS